MNEDEDMLNVLLWRAGVTKAWCKFDNYPQLFLKAGNLPADLYQDPRWYPTGLPLILLSAHATKDVDYTDWMLSFLVRCSEPEPHSFLAAGACARYQNLYDAHALCRFELLTPEQRWGRLQHPDACCCVTPIRDKPFYWRG